MAREIALLNKPILLLGAGGHASVLADILRQQGATIAGLVSPEMVPARQTLAGLRHFRSDDDVLAFDNNEYLLVNGIGSLPGQGLRFSLYRKFIAAGYRFASVVAGSAVVSPYAMLGEGVQIMPGAIIQAGAIIGDNTIINTGAIIEHDCRIGADNHVAPGVTVSGQVETAANVHIGTGASIIQCIRIAEHAVIGAGAVVTRDVPAHHTIYPARTIQINNKG